MNPNQLNIFIIALQSSIEFCTMVITDPNTPPQKVTKFTNYKNKLVKQQEDNIPVLIANCND